MSEKEDLEKTSQDRVSDQQGELNTNYVHENRRYVGLKETILYVVFDMSQSFNINDFDERFVTNILLISLRLQRVVTVVNGIWDIVNDIFSGAIVDKTRTRWGKFKPYLVLLGLPGTIMTCLYWLMPTFLQPGETNYVEFVFYLILALLREGVGTFQGIAQLGMQATITPHPVDRTRLITVANFFSGFLGEKLPSQIMTILIDLIGNNVIGSPQTSYKKAFVGMGVFTTVVSGAAALVFFLVAKERVMQSVDSPSIKQGIKAIINNRPVLLLTLSEMLTGFSIQGSTSDYYTEVLHFASLKLIAGIPGSFVQPFAYALVPWFRRKFSSRVLYIVGAYIGELLYIPVFLFGCIGGKKNGLYKRVVPMGIAFAVWETTFMFFYGIRKVIPSELYNESMDYCEWKNGYRCESMTSVAKGLATKGMKIISTYVRNYIKDNVIGYNQEAWVNGLKQSDSTQFGLFAMCTLVPFVSGSLGIIPMLFYNLDGKKRERMYAELIARREEIAREAKDGDSEALARISKKQMVDISEEGNL